MALSHSTVAAPSTAPDIASRGERRSIAESLQRSWQSIALSTLVGLAAGLFAAATYPDRHVAEAVLFVDAPNQASAENASGDLAREAARVEAAAIKQFGPGAVSLKLDPVRSTIVIRLPHTSDDAPVRRLEVILDTYGAKTGLSDLNATLVTNEMLDRLRSDVKELETRADVARDAAQSGKPAEDIREIEAVLDQRRSDLAAALRQAASQRREDQKTKVAVSILSPPHQNVHRSWVIGTALALLGGFGGLAAGLLCAIWPVPSRSPAFDALRFAEAVGVPSLHHLPSQSDDDERRQSSLRLLSALRTGRKPGRPHVVLIASARRSPAVSEAVHALATLAAGQHEKVLLVTTAAHVIETSSDESGEVPASLREILERQIERGGATKTAMLQIGSMSQLPDDLPSRRRLAAAVNSLVQDFELVLIDAEGLIDDERATALLAIADQVWIAAEEGATSLGDLGTLRLLVDPERRGISGAILIISSIRVAEPRAR